MRASDGTSARVDAWMINRCKAGMKRRKIYNVVESLKEEDGRTVSETKKEIKSDLRKIHSGVFLFSFCKPYCPCIRPNKFTEAKFFDPSSTNIYCVLRLGPGPDQKGLGQENRATTIGAVCGKN